RERDPEIEVIAARELEHEKAYLAELESRGVRVATIDADGRTRDELRAMERDTLAALRDGVEVVYQAGFFHEPADAPAWRGHADFLRRVPGPSDLGAHAYEPEDTKLARHVKPGAVLQLCHYAEHLTRLQGTVPDRIHVVLGGRNRVSLSLRDYSAYY